MAEENDKDLIKTVQQALTIENLLAATKLLEWRSLEEIASAASVSKDRARRSLKTLRTFDRVEESSKGWRINPQGLIRHAFTVQAYLNEQIDRFTKPR